MTTEAQATPTRSALNPPDLFHVGVMVTDLPAAMARMTAIGYRWNDVQTGTLPVRLASGVRQMDFRFVYSLDAPHVELVQEIPGTPWTSAPGNAPHHLGYYVDDFRASLEGLQAAGFTVEAVALPDGETPGIFAFCIDALGTRIEIVDGALRRDWSAGS